MGRRLPAPGFAILLVALATLAVAPLRNTSAAEGGPAPRATPVDTGDLAPDFTLFDQDGQPHTLSIARADKRAVVLVFYRGYW
jgi:cytochrome oxidase Cu insertion factor (SCO1/SenC/PrrC family)